MTYELLILLIAIILVIYFFMHRAQKRRDAVYELFYCVVERAPILCDKLNSGYISAFSLDKIRAEIRGYQSELQPMKKWKFSDWTVSDKVSIAQNLLDRLEAIAEAVGERDYAKQRLGELESKHII